jgi:hypothetical protein
MKRSILLLVLSMLLPPPPAIAANACGPSTAFENDDVKIWFQGFKGHFQIDNRSNGLSYDVQTDGIEERVSGAPAATMDLGHAFPKQTDTCTVEEADGVVTVTFSVTADVKRADHADAGGGANVIGEATATYVVHFNTADNGSKFDLHVTGWPWQQQDSILAFNVDLDAGEGTAVEAAENGVGFRDANGEPIGSFTWAPEFTARYADDTEQTGTVESATATDGSSADVDLSFTNVTAGYDELVYDPWMGVGPYVVVGPLLINDGPIVEILSLLPS